MSNKLTKILDKITHDMSISELQQVYKNKSTSDLSYHDTLYLNIISAHPNRYTSSQIADLLKVTRPAITQKINELAKKGYIIRTQSSKDKRVFYLSVNPLKNFYTQEDIAVEEKVNKLMKAKYGSAETEKLCNMLVYLSDTLFTEKTKVLNYEK